MNLSDSCCIKVFFRTVLPNFSVEVDRVNSLPPENVPYGVTYFVKCKLCARGIYVLCYVVWLFYQVLSYYFVVLCVFNMDTLALSNFLKQNGVPDATTDKLIGMLQISSVISKTRPAG